MRLSCENLTIKKQIKCAKPEGPVRLLKLLIKIKRLI